MANKAQERHLIVEFKTTTQHRDRVKELLQEFIGPARKEAGCLYYDLYQRTDDPDIFFILDGWVDEASLALHGDHPNVKRVLEPLLPLLVGPPSITVNSRLSD